MDPGGQRGIPFLIPMMSSGMEQRVVLTATAPVQVGPPPAFVSSTTALSLGAVAVRTEPPPVVSASRAHPIVSQAPVIDLYRCNTGKLMSDEQRGKDNEKEKEKNSLILLEQSFKELDSRQIDDNLSSFLPNIPGEFDVTEPSTHDNTLRGLVDRPPIGGKEFLPLSGQVLLGFRLKPEAPLPEQYCMDPPSLESKPVHRKRKHKHRNIDKSDKNLSNPSPSPSQPPKLPVDPFSFIKVSTSTMLHSSSHHAPYPHSMVPMSSSHGSLSVTTGQKVQYVSSVPGMAAAPLGMDPGRPNEKKKKKEKKKKDKKEKKKKREKHHSQDPSSQGHTSHSSHSIPPPLLTHSTTTPSPYTPHQHQPSHHPPPI